MDRERSAKIKRTCKIGYIIDWVLNRKEESNEHINRITEDQILRVARDK